MPQLQPVFVALQGPLQMQTSPSSDLQLVAKAGRGSVTRMQEDRARPKVLKTHFMGISFLGRFRLAEELRKHFFQKTLL